MNINNAAASFIMILALVPAGCRTPESDADLAPDEADRPVAVQTFSGTGIVRNITPSGGHIIIEHQEIEGFMGAMTMPFDVRNDTLLRSIAVGDSVDFELSYSDEGTYISAIGIGN